MIYIEDVIDLSIENNLTQDGAPLLKKRFLIFMDYTTLRNEQHWFQQTLWEKKIKAFLSIHLFLFIYFSILWVVTDVKYSVVNMVSLYMTMKHY